VPGSDAIATE